MEDMVPFNGLRGVCAVVIFLGHQTDIFLASPWPPASATAAHGAHQQSVIIGLEYLQAISLFFLLSGIPLARLYMSTGKLETWRGTRRFWRKRCARLGPIYYLTLCLNLLVILTTCDQVDIRDTLQSFAGCALFLQGWIVSLIHVGGVLWQVAVFVYGYLLFPFYSRRVRGWDDKALCWGIVALWAFSAALWYVFGATVYSLTGMKGWGWFIWHAHCASRLPHIVAGVLLGELVDRKVKRRRCDGSSGDQDDSSCAYWATVTDALSVMLVFTAVQAPIVQWYYGTEIRSDVSIGLEAWLLPLHATWLAGMVLAYRSPQSTSNSDSEFQRICWTRRVLSFKPLVALGEISLVLYCLHCTVMFFYTSTYAYIVTGDWRIPHNMADVSLRVQSPWWHAPFQWALVIVVSFAVSRWFEEPLRRMLAGSARKQEDGVHCIRIQKRLHFFLPNR